MPKKSHRATSVASAFYKIDSLAARLDYNFHHFRKIVYGQRPCPAGLENLPKPRRCGRENVWLVDEVEAFLRDRFAAPAADARPAYELTPSPPDSAPSRRGKPTNAERQLAAAAGLTVPAFRKQQQRWAQ